MDNLTLALHLTAQGMGVVLFLMVCIIIFLRIIRATAAFFDPPSVDCAENIKPPLATDPSLPVVIQAAIEAHLRR